MEQFSDMTSSSDFFGNVLLLLSSSDTGPSFMSISSLVLELWQFLFIRDWAEIGNTPIWVLPNIWRLGRVRNIKFGTNFSNKLSLNAAKWQGYSLYRFWVIEGKLTGGGGRVKLPTPPPLRLGFKILLYVRSGYTSLLKQVLFRNSKILE